MKLEMKLRFGNRWQNKILYLLTTNCRFSQCANTKIVNLPMGDVRGKWQCGLREHEYYSFEGIPYGKPPLGPLRFLPSQPAEPWSPEELDCTRDRARPVQLHREVDCVFGDEDCLHLSVYAKSLDNSKGPLPVLVYIHGGGFRTGGANRERYGPDYLMREDIVYVILNYRLCALGFLSLGDPELGVPGNAGLHDQLLALRWVQKHICHFNGDPNNITIMGTSAGAASVHFMMCLPQACGLFHKAIMMSGSILSPWVQVPCMHTFGCRLALLNGYEGNFSDCDILQFLRKLPAENLVRHHFFGLNERVFGHLYPFVPGLELQSSDNKGLLVRPFLQLMREAWSTQVPLLIGGDSFEGLVMYPYVKVDNGHMMDMLKEDPAMTLPYDLYSSLPEEERNARAEELICFHFGCNTINKDDKLKLLDLFSHKLFWHGIHRTVISRFAFAEAPTYLYRFDFDSPDNNLMRIDLCGDDIKRGVCHADELGYIFPRAYHKPLNACEYQTVQRMVGILTSFMRTGNPNCVETKSVTWTSVNENNPFEVLNIGNEVEIQTQSEMEGIKKWNLLYNNDRGSLYGIE